MITGSNLVKFVTEIQVDELFGVFTYRLSLVDELAKSGFIDAVYKE